MVSKLIRSAARLGLVAIAACSLRAPATVPNLAASSSDSAHAPRGARFYAGRPDGSESEFNPLTAILNEGFDQTSRDGANREVFRIGYATAASNVYHSIIDPPRTFKFFGIRDWLRDEVFPITGKANGGGQWVPNYELHLLGEGMTSIRLEEWYAQHGWAHPTALAELTTGTFSFLNEMIEHQTGDGKNEDAATDLLLFDTGGMLLWRSDAVQRALSGRVRITTWFEQPMFTPASTLRGVTMQNVVESYMLRAHLGGDSDNWRPMTTIGGSFLLGASRRVDGDHWVSLAAGWDPAQNPVIDARTGEQSVVLQPNYGAYYDHDGSLLASLLLRTARSERLALNIYPGVFRFGRVSPGFVAQLLSSHQMRVGIISSIGLGLGTSPAQRD